MSTIMERKGKIVENILSERIPEKLPLTWDKQNSTDVLQNTEKTQIKKIF